MRKLIPLLLVAGLTVVVTSCGKGTQSGAVTVWHYFSVDSQVQELKDLAVLYNQTSPKVQVNYVFVPYDQLPNKVVAGAAAGHRP